MRGINAIVSIIMIVGLVIADFQPEVPDRIILLALLVIISNQGAIINKLYENEKL